MKKRFVKVALLSLAACASTGAFVACSDDDWKSPVENVETSVEGINKTVGQLDEQIKALDVKIAESKAAADAAAQAAADAMAAAQAADTKAEDAKKYADEAAQKYAEEAAQRAIQAAAEQLKAEIEAVKALIQANADAIASNKEVIDGNSEAIKENAGKIEGNTKAIEDLLNALNEYKGENDSKIQEILDKLDAVGVDIENLGAELGDKIAGLNAALEVLEGKCEALGLDITKLEEALRAEIGTLSETLAAQIASETAAREAGDAELKKMIEELTERIDALDLATNLEEFSQFVASAQTQLDALNAFKEKMETDFAALKGKVDGIETIVNNNTAAIDELTGKLNETADKAAKNAADILALTTSVTKNTERIEDLEEFKAQATKDIESLNGEIDEINERLNAIAPLLNTMIFDQLRGLVFMPEAYVGGIESAIAYNVYFSELVRDNIIQDLYEYTDNNNGKVYTVSNYDEWNLYTSQNEIPDRLTYPVVTYHMNPKSAVVKYEDLSFVCNDAQVMTRADEEIGNIDLDKTYNDGTGLKIADGKLSVRLIGDSKFYERYEKYYSVDNKMPVFALQAKVQAKDEVDEEGNPIVNINNITSDYAMFVLKKVTPTAIEWYKDAFKDKFHKEPFPAVDNNSGIHNVLAPDVTKTTAQVEYNSKEGLNLVNLLAVKYTDTTPGRKDNEQAWTNKDWEKCGLKMNFELIDYYIGNNKVSESSWATITEEGVVIPNGDVNGIGHMPLVYVTVTYNGVPVVNGFLKVKIVPAQNYYMTNAITYANIDFTCCEDEMVNMPSSYNPLKMMLDVTGFTKEVFEANYTPRFTAGSNDEMAQFMFNGNEWEEVTDYIGTVTRSEQYNFDWTFNGIADKEKIYVGRYDNQGKERTGTTFICFTGGNPNLYPDIYIPLTTTVNEKLVLSMGEKNQAHWFRDHKVAMLNVNIPGEKVKHIDTELNQIWAGDKAVFTRVSGYPEIFTQPEYQYYFTAENDNIFLPDPNPMRNGLPVEGNSAIEYPPMKLTVDNLSSELLIPDGDSFITNGSDDEYHNNTLYIDELSPLGNVTKHTPIATLTADGRIQYLDGAEKYLNMYSSMGGEGRPDVKLLAKVGIVPYNSCYVAYKSQNPDFDIAFIRPINIDPNTVYPFADADSYGSKNNIVDMLLFSDWRNIDFSTDLSLYKFYNIKSIVPDTEGIYTNMSTIESDPTKFVPASQSLKDAFEYAPVNEITYNGTPTKSDLISGFGTIIYHNTGINVKEFQVMIPFTVKYELGEFKIYVKCTIKTTLGN